MEYIVFGAGRMGRAIAYDLIRSAGYNNVTIVDRDRKCLEDTKNLVENKRLKCVYDEIASARIKALMPEAKTAIGAASYTLNEKLSLLAIQGRTNFCDLGGNPDVVKKQFKLDKAAKGAGVTLIPDCGLAPGMMSVLTADAMQDIIYAQDIKIRVGGLPQNPKGMLKYMIVFSPEGLINEYIEDGEIVKNMETEKAKGMSGLEKISFEGLPELEAFYTGGGTSTLPETYAGRVKNLDYKTIRYAGHCKKMKKLLDAYGIKQGGRNKYRKELENILEYICSCNDKDMVLARTSVRGKYKSITYEFKDYEDEKSGLTAMMRTTCFPVSVIAQMVSLDMISQKGVRPQELAVPSKEFIYQLRLRKINIEKKIII